MGRINGLIVACAGALSLLRRMADARSPLWLHRWRIPIACAIVVVAGGALLIAPWGCTPQAEPPSTSLSGTMIRVRLLGEVDQVVITASQPPVYHCASDTADRLLGLPVNTPMTVTLAPAGWRIGNVTLGQGELTLRPVADGTLAVNSVLYRGQYRLVPVDTGRFDVVNDLDIDQYLKGVLPKELWPDWHPEAYRAQAIAARTYALYEKYLPRTPRHWDVLPDQRSQVYGGMRAETAKSREAVDATRGIVLASGPAGHERIFKTYFSSCCGGVTQSVADAFGEPAIEPLQAHASGPWCSISPKYNWGPVVVRKDELAGRLRQWGAARGHSLRAIPGIRAVEIAGRNPLGRPTTYVITDTRGQPYALRGEDFRVAFNTGSEASTYLYSSYIETIINEPDRIRLVGGHGYGHGVGLCQWCAEARARGGVSHEDILIASYPGARLIRAY